MLSNNPVRPEAKGEPDSRLARILWPLIALAEFSRLRPAIALVAIVLLTAIMLVGFKWLAADDSLESFLRADTPGYHTYETLRDRFPSSDLDVFVTAEAPNLFTADRLQAMQDLNFTLLIADPVKSVLSIFSLKQPLTSGDLPPSILPEDIPEDEAKLNSLSQQIYAHPIANNRLLSSPDAPQQLSLFVVGLDPEFVRANGLPATIDLLKEEIAAIPETESFKIGVAGVPAMKAEVIVSTARDIVLFNSVGLLVGAMICWLFFRRALLVLIANIPTALAVVFCLGLFGWTGTKIDPLMNAIMPLVLVVTYNNAMHYLFAICRNLDSGLAKGQAIRYAAIEIGPACALTSITTSIALFSLMFSSSPLIKTFGLLAGSSVLIALTLIIVIMPVCAVYLLKDGRSYLHGKGSHQGISLLDRLAERISRTVNKNREAYVTFGALLTGFFFFAYFLLEPQYRLSEMLPDHGQAADVTKRMEDRLGGVFPLNVMMKWPTGETPTSPAVRNVTQSIHQAVAAHPRISKVSSLNDLQNWAQSGGLAPQAAAERLLDDLPPSIRSRFVDLKSGSAIITGYIADLEAREILRLSAELEGELDRIRAANPNFEISLTGLSSIAASRSTSVISQLSISMLGAVIVVIAVIGLAFGSLAMAGLSVLPNLFAIFATGTWLLFTNGGLDYATVVGLTVAFGLAVDDTIHVLNRFQIEKQTAALTSEATDRTLRLIGTVLILTTAVLLAGLSVTQLSAVPPTRQFGLICIFTLLFALIADLVILPALILVTHGTGDRRAARIALQNRPGTSQTAETIKSQ
ncbi:MAG: MMPL family transporter [Alphaproteobacteria bacterium]|nr:MMPL family transporter [Alphaproteobacteria bacterium]